LTERDERRGSWGPLQMDWRESVANRARIRCYHGIHCLTPASSHSSLIYCTLMCGDWGFSYVQLLCLRCGQPIFSRVLQLSVTHHCLLLNLLFVYVGNREARTRRTVYEAYMTPISLVVTLLTWPRSNLDRNAVCFSPSRLVSGSTLKQTMADFSATFPLRINWSSKDLTLYRLSYWTRR
jgi:hypothetical protein